MLIVRLTLTLGLGETSSLVCNLKVFIQVISRLSAPPESVLSIPEFIVELTD